MWRSVSTLGVGSTCKADGVEAVFDAGARIIRIAWRFKEAARGTAPLSILPFPFPVSVFLVAERREQQRAAISWEIAALSAAKRSVLVFARDTSCYGMVGCPDTSRLPLLIKAAKDFCMVSA